MEIHRDASQRLDRRTQDLLSRMMLGKKIPGCS